MKNVDLTIGKSEFVSINGASGGGKSTLLNIIGGLLTPDEGEVIVNNKNLLELSNNELADFRKTDIGFVFQQFYLIPYLTIFENIKFASQFKNIDSKIEQLLNSCLLKDKSNQIPSQISVGEKQRTAFIRAIINSQAILLADEPTGNLDKKNSDILLNLIKEYNRNGGTVIIISHDERITSHANKKFILEKGQLYSC